MRSMAAGIDANNYDSGAVRLLAAAIDEIVGLSAATGYDNHGGLKLSALAVANGF
jgi:hypothetical protein